MCRHVCILQSYIADNQRHLMHTLERCNVGISVSLRVASEVLETGSCKMIQERMECTIEIIIGDSNSAW